MSDHDPTPTLDDMLGVQRTPVAPTRRRRGRRTTSAPKGPWWWRTLKFSMNAVVSLALVVFAGTAILSRTGKIQLVPMRSGSMRPVVDAGDLALLVPKAAKDIKVGDVIAFIPPKKADTDRYVHRVIEVVGFDPQPTVITKGDANPVADPWGAIRLNKPTVWTYKTMIPRGGYLIYSLKTTFWRRAMILIGAGCLLLPMLRSIWAPKPKATPQAETATDALGSDGNAPASRADSLAGES